MKYTIVCISVLVTLCAHSQVKVSFSSLSGYETNIYKSPSSFVSEGELLDKNDLFASSAYQDGIIQFKYGKNWDNSNLKISFTPEIRYYFSQEDAQRIVLNGRVKYGYNFSRNTKWENSVSFKNKNQKGQDLDANELSTPLGYNRINLESKVSFRLSKKNRTAISLSYGNKSFDASESRQVSYDIYGLNLSTKQVRWKNHLLHSYGVNIGFFGRKYTLFSLEDETNSFRSWNYFNAEIFYKFPFHKKLSVQPELGFEKRMDETSNQFGYNEFSAGFKLKYTSDKFLLNLAPNFSFRSFDQLNTTGSSTQKLNYKYIRANMNLEYKLNKRLSITSRAYVIDRNSNNNNINTTAYRSYQNNYFGLGLKFIF